MFSSLFSASRSLNVPQFIHQLNVICKVQCVTFHVSSINWKIIPGNLKGKSSSSAKWLTRHLNDPYVKKSRYEQYRARSAFKLIEIDDKYKLLKPGMVVVECGAAPGAWTQVLTRRLELAEEKSSEEKSENASLVISIDKNPFQSVPGAITIPNTDFTSPFGQAKILSALNDRKVDLICSDMAPNATGIHSVDHEAIINLVFCALKFSLTVLQVNGNFLCKIWDGHQTKVCIDMIDKFFTQVHRIKPPSSRDDSSEDFILARGFRGTVHTENK